MLHTGAAVSMYMVLRHESRYMRRTRRDLVSIIGYRSLPLPRPLTQATIADGLAMSDV